ncbi:MAG: peptide/nickel transport system ATP-binding protein [Kiritimatiellia bacterium]
MALPSTSNVAERYRWICSDLQSQLADIDGIDIKEDGSTFSISAADRVTTLTLDGEGDTARVRLHVDDGDSHAFRWADGVNRWFDETDGTPLFDIIRKNLPNPDVLKPARMVAIGDLRTYFHTEEGIVKAVDGLTVSIQPGHTLGLVGESGSGKSVTSLTIMGLLPEFTARIPSGHVSFLGKDLLSIRKSELSKLRGQDIAMIFQEPMTALNPVYRVGDQVAEAIMKHDRVSRAVAMKRTIKLFEEVGIPDPPVRARSYPHEMSGGQKQRVMIAMALSCNPRLLIADEPTTALDVTIQRQILDLLRDLRDNRGMAILFITHDLGVIAEIADDVAVMFRGKLVEYGDVVSVFKAPAHAYTRGLLACRPRLDTKYQLLPTVADFLDTTVVDGEVVITERPLDPNQEERLMNGARPKMPVGVGEPVLSVKDLKVWFSLKKTFFGTTTRWVKAVDGISFDVFEGQTLGLVGESGCGKTTTGRAILHLINPRSGDVVFEGNNLSYLGDGSGQRRKILYAVSGALVIASMLVLGMVVGGVPEMMGLNIGIMGYGLWLLLLLAGIGTVGTGMSMLDPREQDLRRKLQIIFQDPYSSLNPRLTIGQAITEPMKVHKIGKNDKDRQRIAGELLDEVGLERAYLRRFPHEFSGGQRQRICIARTLALEPKFIICDESVSALDVSVQAQVLNLLKDLQIRRGLTYIFISHDLSVVKFMSDVMCVMKDGVIVEMGPSDDIYANPAEEYTRQLIQAIPRDDVEHIEELQAQRMRAQKKRLEEALAAK